MNSDIKYIRVKVRPKSSNQKITQVLDDGTIKINLKSAPENGKANTELISFLSNHYKVHHSQITIISGHTSALKLLKISYES